MHDLEKVAPRKNITVKVVNYDDATRRALVDKWSTNGSSSEVKYNGSFACEGPNSALKYSYNYVNCIGVVIVGSTEDGDELSIMTHQNPANFLANPNFGNELRLKCEELKGSIQPGTVDASLFGGCHLDVQKEAPAYYAYLGLPNSSEFDSKLKGILKDKISGEDEIFEQIKASISLEKADFLAPFFARYHADYKNAIQITASIINEVFGVQPVIAMAPTTVADYTNAYFDTLNRELSLERPESDEPILLKALPASEVDKVLVSMRTSLEATL